MTSNAAPAPDTLDATSFEQLEPAYRALITRPIAGREDLERWLVDRSDLAAACSEARANLYISQTCDTDDAQAAQAYTRYVDEVEPRLKPLTFALEKRFVELAALFPLDAGRYGVLERASRTEVELFRPENIPIETRLALLAQQFEKVAGSLTVHFDGQERTLPQMGRYQEVTDRAVREAAWRAVAERRLREVSAFDDLYDRMIALRHQQARNANFADYVGFAYKSKHRFDYTVRDCTAFHDSIERAVVPLMRALDKDRAARLRVAPLLPWDLAVDELGRPPLAPFSGGRQLMDKSVAAMQSLDGRLAAMLASLGDGSEARGAADGACLDLDSRKGKAPGGYQYQRDLSRRAFIFMNAAGLHKDVETMVHEAGHAFHSMLSNDEPLLEYRHSPIEFAEVASMGMELLSMKHWAAPGSFYERKPQDFRRACREQIKRSVLLLPWIAAIDAFQHWVYANPAHSREERRAHWLMLDERFGSAVSWEGLDQFRPNQWQRQLHLFSHPFYYVEYGIAQLGALQLWLKSLEAGEKTAIDFYIRALSLGGSKPLPELFAAAGLEFDFSDRILKRLVDRVIVELEKAPQ